MNKLTIYTLKALRKAYAKLFNIQSLPKPACEQNPDVVSKLIYDMLMDDKPCMIARFGSTELATMVNYIGVKQADKSVFNFISGKSNAWWWNDNILLQMQNWSGFFPPKQDKIEQFCELMLEDMKELDVLGSWLENEKLFESCINKVVKVNLELLNPYFSLKPWTVALEGKKVLVVHPFSATIESQYKKRKLIFQNNLLPVFKLKTIKAIQSIAGEKTPFNDWFEALEFMKTEIDKCEYDVCLIGAGAYGFPLAAHVKRQGKKAIHLAGSLQLLFGIKGKRWENPNYNPLYNYSELMNDHWVYANDIEKPKNAHIVEGGCYW